MTNELPFSHVVGQPRAQLALQLLAIDPTIGGVLLVGPPGSAKTTLARGLTGLLGEGAPFVEIPLGATEDRVKGSIDVASVLADGEVRIHDGLLSAANGGVLYIDEINLLADHLVDLILDAAATGINRVERDTLSVVQPARFSLIGTMNPEEGELRPQLLDRFAMVVSVDPLMEPKARHLALVRRLGVELGVDETGDVLGRDALGHRENEAMLAQTISDARRRLDNVEVISRLSQIARLCSELGIGSLRTDLAIAKAARANAALMGRDQVTDDDISTVAELITSHRQRDAPRPGATTGSSAKDPSTKTSPEREGHDSPASDGRSTPPANDRGEVSVRDSDATSDRDDQTDQTDQTDDADQPMDATDNQSFSDHLSSFSRRAPSVTGQGAEVSRHRETSVGGTFSLSRTVVARLGRGGEDGLTSQDLRYVAIERAPKRCVIFVVDVSASVAGREAMDLVNEAIEGLLGTAYRERAQVAVVSFGGETAEVSLRPTRSLEVARSRLLGLKRSGRTPLSRGLQVGRGLALDLRRRGTEPLVVVLTDARPNEVDVGDPFVAALDEAERYAVEALEMVVVDLESNSFRLGFAQQLAEIAGALYVQAQAS
jgi:magnesium chelatase subunit D